MRWRQDSGRTEVPPGMNCFKDEVLVRARCYGCTALYRHCSTALALQHCNWHCEVETWSHNTSRALQHCTRTAALKAALHECCSTAQLRQHGTGSETSTAALHGHCNRYNTTARALQHSTGTAALHRYCSTTKGNAWILQYCTGTGTLQLALHGYCSNGPGTIYGTMVQFIHMYNLCMHIWILYFRNSQCVKNNIILEHFGC